MTQFDINQIQKILPHRYPFLMIDRVIEVDSGKTLTAIKNVSRNEPFFEGHFPHLPVFPGVLMLECIAQASAILASLMIDATASGESVYLFAGVDKARFKRPVGPGDQLIVTARLTRQLRGIYRFEAAAHVDNELVSSAQFMTTEMEGPR